MFKIKIAVLGPSRSGKTCISNFLSNDVEQFGGEYRPTKGVRILEFESPYVNVDGKSINAEIEMWDCSGDVKFKQFWPVFMHKTDGYVFVYDSTGINEAKELELFLEYLLNMQDIDPNNCIIFLNNKGKNKRSGRKLSDKFSPIPQITIDVENELKNIKNQFNNFLTNILERMWHMKDQEDYLFSK